MNVRQSAEVIDGPEYNRQYEERAYHSPRAQAIIGDQPEQFDRPVEQVMFLVPLVPVLSSDVVFQQLLQALFHTGVVECDE